ncbi:kinase-like protein [Ceratobasidium sp. AG-I]|nr:kinase-like protein [Ceratobasidium sp. AG-I]
MGIAVFRDQMAMISQWMQGGTLHDYIRQDHNVDRWALCLQIAEGLAYIHGIGMVHGDLKSMNILVSANGVVKLSDFGNSVLSEHSIGFTASDGAGTCRWTAPELHMEDGESPGVRSMEADVYALGMTILEVITRKLPYFETTSDMRVILSVTQGKKPRRPDELLPSTQHGDERWNMLLTCWDMKPEIRPTALDLHNTMCRLR